MNSVLTKRLNPLVMDYFWFKQTSQVVYQGGDILTMNGSKPEYVDCIVTEGAEIVYVGKSFVIAKCISIHCHCCTH